MDYMGCQEKGLSMLVITLFVVFLSPFTAFSVTAVTLPKITSFTFDIGELANNRGKRLILRCKAMGMPSPIIEFQKNGVRLTNSSKVIIDSLGDGELYIRNVTYENDDGVYRCVATNAHGKVFKEREIQIPTVGKFLPGNEFTNPPFVESVRINAGKRLHCPQHTHANPVSYFWGFKNARTGRLQRFEMKRRHHLLSDGTILFFAMVTEDDIKTISDKKGLSCFMNVQGDIVASRKYILTSAGNPLTDDIAPRIFGELDGDNFVIKGESLTLHCAAAGNPMPSVKWYKDGVEINVNDSSKYGINVGLPEKLTLREVTKDMEGEYKCVFTNRQSSAYSKSNIYVAELPKIVAPLPSLLNVNSGKTVRLVCNVTGTGPFNFTWYRNGSQLSSYSKENYTMDVKGNVIEINMIRNNDAGTYQCFASSKYGEVSSATQVVVEDPRAIGTIGNNENGNNSSNSVEADKDSPLELKYIIIIACTSAVLFVVACGGVFLYCRTKKDESQEQFIATPKPPYDNYQHNNKRYQRPAYDNDTIYDSPSPPSNLTESDDDGMSTYKSGAKMNYPMHTLKSDSSDTTRSEHFYYDIPEDGKSSIAPSTDL